MMSPKTERVKPISLGDIATEAGVSRMTVSYALRNSPQITAKTRKKVMAAAKKLGYIPDARLATLMAGVRSTKSRDFIPIAWLSVDLTEGTWRNTANAPYLKGAMRRCEEMGYKLDEIWLKEPGMSARRISDIIHNRGIQGVIIAPSGCVGVGHIRLEWKKFACVSFEKYLLAPRLHRVAPDYLNNIGLALKTLRRFGYRRIGCYLHHISERHSLHAYLAGISYFQTDIPSSDRVPPLLFGHREEKPGKNEKFYSWIQEFSPDVIVCQHSKVVQWLEERGYRVPRDIGVVHMAVEDDVKDWAGIWQRKREIGAQTAEQVISMIQNNRFGLPAVAHDVVIPGYWKFGKTLIAPKS